ncbi:MAG: GntR family transcriptional regulator [Candidatus Limivivens sp.]|nr:GntR family transcriptional regulator [Candidatus Limivivens sp.]
MGEPLYKQLVDDLRRKIQEGELKAGDRLPTEFELSEQYKVSRITVRKALELLVDEELLFKRHGIGTFVAEKRLERNTSEYMGFTQACQIEGRKPSSILLSVDLQDATETDKANLSLGPNERIIRIIRIRCCDEQPVALEEMHLSQKYAIILSKDLTGSIHQLLFEEGIVLTHGMKIIDLCYANPREVEALGVEPEEALLLQKDIGYDEQDHPIYYCKSVTNPKKYKIVVYN